MAATTVTFGYDGKLDTFTAPISGIYTIDAYGAQGGKGLYAGGYGGESKADFYLDAGTVLDIVVGQQGGDGFSTRDTGNGTGGGGGGTFVATLVLKDKGPQMLPLLLISAGGGGGGKGGSGSSSGYYGRGGGGLGGGGVPSLSGNGTGQGGFGGGYGGEASLGIGSDDGFGNYGSKILLVKGTDAVHSPPVGLLPTKTSSDGGYGGKGGDNGIYLASGTGGYNGGSGIIASSATNTSIVAKDGVEAGNGFLSITYTPVPPTPTPVVDFKKDPAKYMGAIRDYDGNNLGGASSWKLLGDADIKGDGGLESILVNPEIGRFASVGVASGTVDFSKYGLNGDTRVVGIYIDPTLKNKPENIGGPLDSQKRFQTDLKKDNLKLLAAGDYNKDGFQDLYFKLGDGSAVLRAVMFKDGNIQYANYQSKADLTTFMTDNKVNSSVWGGWI